MSLLVYITLRNKISFHIAVMWAIGCKLIYFIVLIPWECFWVSNSLSWDQTLGAIPRERSVIGHTAGLFSVKQRYFRLFVCYSCHRSKSRLLSGVCRVRGISFFLTTSCDWPSSRMWFERELTWCHRTCRMWWFCCCYASLHLSFCPSVHLIQHVDQNGLAWLIYQSDGYLQSSVSYSARW